MLPQKLKDLINNELSDLYKCYLLADGLSLDTAGLRNTMEDIFKIYLYTILSSTHVPI